MKKLLAMLMAALLMLAMGAGAAGEETSAEPSGAYHNNGKVTGFGFVESSERNEVYIADIGIPGYIYTTEDEYNSANDFEIFFMKFSIFSGIENEDLGNPFHVQSNSQIVITKMWAETRNTIEKDVIRWSSDTPGMEKTDFTENETSADLYIKKGWAGEFTVYATFTVDGQPGSASVDCTTNGQLGGSGGKALESGDYVIGFVWIESGNIYNICTGRWGFGDSTSKEYSADNEFKAWKEFEICAGVRKQDSTGAEYFELAPQVGITVNRMWVEITSGDGEADDIFRWNEGTAGSSKMDFDGSASAQLYMKEGWTGEFWVKANITVTIGGEEETGEVQVHCIQDRKEIITYSEDAGTIAGLNGILTKVATDAETGPDKAVYIVNLKDASYEGIVEIPEIFDGDKELYINGADNNQTFLNGHIDLNGAQLSKLNNLNFRAKDTNEVAIYGGQCVRVQNCSFDRYAIAVDSSEGIINCSHCTFANNGTAVKIDVKKASIDLVDARTTWEYNNFIDNEIAVQILSFESYYITPYYFRIYNSNFLSNGVDFDVQSGGMVYFYKNFYGLKGSRTAEDWINILTTYNSLTGDVYEKSENYRPAVIKASSCKVITNPRWTFPVLGNATSDYYNFLVVDWVNSTAIDNDIAYVLKIDASSFDEVSDEKNIDVVDENSELIGSWNFEGE